MKPASLPLRLSVAVDNRSIECINKFRRTKVWRLYKFIENISENELDEIGKGGIHDIINAIFSDREVLNPETDDEFIQRLTGMVFGFSDDDERRLLEIAKRVLNESKTK